MSCMYTALVLQEAIQHLRDQRKRAFRSEGKGIPSIPGCEEAFDTV